MKQGSFKFICLVIWACITVLSGFGDDAAVSWETKVLETFNGRDDALYAWKTVASRFATSIDEDKFPKLAYIDAYPAAAFGNFRNRNNEDQQEVRSLGLHGKFDRPGYNWIDLYPVLKDDADEKPYEIRIPGRVRSIDMWVWGSNHRFYMEVYLRDHNGVVHRLNLGDINFIGWKNMRLNIPTHISQSRRTLPFYAGLTFVKFRIWTRPQEKVDNFYIYFKELRVLTDVFENLFDGNDLADQEHVDSLWASN